MSRLIVLALFMLGAFTLQASALEWPHVKPKKIGPNTYVIEHGPHDEDPGISHGFHNNPGIIVTGSGVVVIDTGSSYEIGKMILRNIASITDKPITHIFTTHFHGDHWLANQALVEAYPHAQTIAHPNLITLLKAGDDQFWLREFSNRLGDKFSGTQAVIPNTPAQSGDYTIGGTTFRVTVFDKAHTETDLMVYVVEEGVLFTGDIVNREHTSFMGHGNFSGAYEATKKAMAMNPKYVVVGHGRSGEPELVQVFSEFYRALLTVIKKYYDQGLADFEMKPMVIADLKKYQAWHDFDRRVGQYINQIITETEAESLK